MQIESFAFPYNGQIPTRFTCDGENINPSLSIKGVPTEAKSLALIVRDPDIPMAVKLNNGITVFDHWVMWNIPADTLEINQGSTPADAVVGLNGAGKNEYAGPCPPDREHRYFFRLYALDTRLDLPEKTTAMELEVAIQGHILAEAELIGRYGAQRQKI